MLLLLLFLKKRESEANYVKALFWITSSLFSNIIICIYGWFWNFTETYLNVASFITWMLINIQGNLTENFCKQFYKTNINNKPL